VPEQGCVGAARCVGGTFHHTFFDPTRPAPEFCLADLSSRSQPLVRSMEFEIETSRIALKKAVMQLSRARLRRDSAVLLRGFPERLTSREDGGRAATQLCSPREGHSHDISTAERVVSGFLRSHRRGAIRATGVAPAALAAVAAAMAGTAWAQNPPDDTPAPPSPGAVRSSPLPAPVGHRQPRAADIPPPPPGDNAREAEPRDDINDKLRICRGC
jgi:hypothetical protein